MHDTTDIASPTLDLRIENPADTLTRDTIEHRQIQAEKTDTAEFVPQYINGLSKVCIKPVPNPVIEYPVATIVVPEGIEGEHRNPKLWENNGVTILLLAVFLMVSISFRPGIRLINQMIDSLFDIRDHKGAFTGVTVTETRLRIILQIQTLILEGICLAWFCNLTLPQTSLSIFPMVIIAIASVTLYYLLQRLLYGFIAWVFTQKAEAGIWLSSNVTLHSLLGISMFPLVFILIYIPQLSLYAFISAGVLYIASRIIFIYKGVKIFLRDIYGLLYFILYLCALEIAPLFLLIKGVMWIYNIVELKALLF